MSYTHWTSSDRSQWTIRRPSMDHKEIYGSSVDFLWPISRPIDPSGDLLWTIGKPSMDHKLTFYGPSGDLPWTFRRPSTIHQVTFTLQNMRQNERRPSVDYHEITKTLSVGQRTHGTPAYSCLARENSKFFQHLKMRCKISRTHQVLFNSQFLYLDWLKRLRRESSLGSLPLEANEQQPFRISDTQLYHSKDRNKSHNVVAQKQPMTDRCYTFAHVSRGAAIFTLLLWHHVECWCRSAIYKTFFLRR